MYDAPRIPPNNPIIATWAHQGSVYGVGRNRYSTLNAGNQKDGDDREEAIRLHEPGLPLRKLGVVGPQERTRVEEKGAHGRCGQICAGASKNARPEDGGPEKRDWQRIAQNLRQSVGTEREGSGENQPGANQLRQESIPSLVRADTSLK